MQKIAIFTESSQSFGMGHLMRMRLWREIILSYAQKKYSAFLWAAHAILPDQASQRMQYF